MCINVLEVPSGAIADTWGRRRSMVCSMLAYMLSFVVFAVARSYASHFPAMLLFAVGEAFRLVSNDIAIEAHVASGIPGPWVVSAGRADVVRARLTSIGLPPERIERLTGFGAGQPVMRNEAAPRNNRVEIILLRHQL